MSINMLMLKRKWYEANLALTREKSIKQKWYEANLEAARQGQKNWK
ncbi:MAG: hypothetical protein Q9N32_05425 [Gammaproteobacteria bacterium]|nr:hypothetical protein [Gammaproteobacteria bacterium]